jgi:hypothetical protein
MSGARTIALVESATQLLNAAEWAHAAGEVHAVRVIVLAPTDPQSLRQIASVAAAVRSGGLDVAIYPVRAKRPGLPLLAARVLNEIARADRLVIGDPFSRYIHTMLPASRADHVVIVDDGTATWDYARCIDRGEPLTRWSHQATTAKPHAVRATRLLSPSIYRSVDVFSCLRHATPRGATALTNRYSWTRSRWQPQVTTGEVDLLGTSLVDTGVVQRRAYLAAVSACAQLGQPVRYLAHRRESENLVAEVATIPNLRVLRPLQPVEILLRSGPVAQRVVAFPSTAAHTLPVVLCDVDVTFDVLPIDPDWFTDEATFRARSFVARIAAEAPVRPSSLRRLAPPRRVATAQ